MAHQVVDQSVLGAPVVGEASHVRDDERHVGILGGDELDDRDFADRIVEHRYRKGARDLADLARQPRVVAMHLDADETILLDRGLHQISHPAAIPGGMDKGKAIEAVGRLATMRATSRLAIA